MTVEILVGSAMLDWTQIAVTEDNSWVVIGISAVSGDVASLEYVENMISGCKDERVSSPTSLINSKDLDISQNWISDGAITM